eukprot:669998-Rhodomonas_salina.3
MKRTSYQWLVPGYPVLIPGTHVPCSDPAGNLFSEQKKPQTDLFTNAGRTRQQLRIPSTHDAQVIQTKNGNQITWLSRANSRNEKLARGSCRWALAGGEIRDWAAGVLLVASGAAFKLH